MASATATPTADTVTVSKSELAALMAQLDALKKAKPAGLSLKVSDKGGVSVYGMGRFPVTLYVEQWERLLDHAETIREFLKANDAQLKRKAA